MEEPPECEHNLCIKSAAVHSRCDWQSTRRSRVRSRSSSVRDRSHLWIRNSRIGAPAAPNPVSEWLEAPSNASCREPASSEPGDRDHDDPKNVHCQPAEDTGTERRNRWNDGSRDHEMLQTNSPGGLRHPRIIRSTARPIRSQTWSTCVQLLQVAVCNSIRSCVDQLCSITRSCDSRPVPIPAPGPGLHYRQCWLPGLKRGHGSLRMPGQHSTSRSRSRSENNAGPMYN